MGATLRAFTSSPLSSNSIDIFLDCYDENGEEEK
jgi:hypothetical protein